MHKTPIRFNFGIDETETHVGYWQKVCIASDQVLLDRADGYGVTREFVAVTQVAK